MDPLINRVLSTVIFLIIQMVKNYLAVYISSSPKHAFVFYFNFFFLVFCKSYLGLFRINIQKIELKSHDDSRNIDIYLN